MSEESSPEVVRRKLDPERGEPNVQVAEIVADIKDTEPAELENMYGCIDHTIDHIFSNPPSSGRTSRSGSATRAVESRSNRTGRRRL